MNLISSKLDRLPEFLSTKHLVELGLYNSIDAAYQARLHGKSPAFLKMNRKILYPKEYVIEFLKTHLSQGTHSPTSINT